MIEKKRNIITFNTEKTFGIVMYYQDSPISTNQHDSLARMKVEIDHKTAKKSQSIVNKTISKATKHYSIN